MLSSMKATSWLKSEKHRQLVERWWIYFVIVVCIAVPYAKSTAKMLFAILANHWSNAFKYGVVAVVLHFVPDVYILVTAKHVPRSLFDSFIVMGIIFTIFAVHGVVTHVRSNRKK